MAPGSVDSTRKHNDSNISILSPTFRENLVARWFFHFMKTAKATSGQEQPVVVLICTMKKQIHLRFSQMMRTIHARLAAVLLMQYWKTQKEICGLVQMVDSIFFIPPINRLHPFMKETDCRTMLSMVFRKTTPEIFG